MAMEVKCIIELNFDNGNDKVSYLDVHDLEKLLDDNGYDIKRIVFAPVDECRDISFGAMMK